MSRKLSALMLAELKSASLSPRFLAYFDFPSGAVRLWNGVGNLSWNAETWTGVGNLGTIQLPDGGMDISAQGATFQLSGIPSSMVSASLAADYQNRVCRFWFAVVDSSETVIGTPYRWEGRMDTIDIDEGAETSVITLRAESRLIDLERPRERRYSDQDLQQEYAGDLGLEFASVIPDMPINWGQPNKPNTVPQRPPQPKSSA